MAAGPRPKNRPAYQPPKKPDVKSEPRIIPRNLTEPAPVRQDSRERRPSMYHTLDWARGIERDRGWGLTDGRDQTKGTDRSKGRDRTGTFRS